MPHDIMSFNRRSVVEAERDSSQDLQNRGNEKGRESVAEGPSAGDGPFHPPLPGRTRLLPEHPACREAGLTAHSRLSTAPAACPVCTITDDATGRSSTFDKFDLSGDFGERRPILTRNGITTIEAFNRQLAGYEAYRDFRSYGSWLSHSAFAVETFSAEFELDNGFEMVLKVRAALVGGERTGDRPTGTATWRGVMVGTTHAGPVRGDIFQEDAALTFTTAGGGSMQAAFTDIVNLDRKEPYATPGVRFADVPVSDDGTFRKGALGHRIHGTLYGPGHAETAGIFEHSDIVGAFGAIRE